ncbi:hypothetical protein J1N35_013126 [Gossypium stocksii]|uniref:Uncharacterized protein n=1 Tax=Gossypium stocksii TaxID=47602 RepID=A0A9D3VRW9_9ROSI|nr:hypothetical protein J1N35_013126 [Gossypium stocksii]
MKDQTKETKTQSRNRLEHERGGEISTGREVAAQDLSVDLPELEGGFGGFDERGEMGFKGILRR